MNTDSPVTVPKFAEFHRRSLAGTLIAGIASGGLIVTVSRLLDKMVISPALCRGADQAACTNSDVVSLHIAAVAIGILAVVILVNTSVYRPLLVVIAVTIGLWNASTWSLSLSWPWAIAGLIIAYSLSYLALGWVLRIYNFVVALLLAALLVAAMIIVPNLSL